MPSHILTIANSRYFPFLSTVKEGGIDYMKDACRHHADTFGSFVGMIYAGLVAALGWFLYGCTAKPIFAILGGAAAVFLFIWILKAYKPPRVENGSVTNLETLSRIRLKAFPRRLNDKIAELYKRGNGAHIGVHELRDAYVANSPRRDHITRADLISAHTSQLRYDYYTTIDARYAKRRKTIMWMISISIAVGCYFFAGFNWWQCLVQVILVYAPATSALGLRFYPLRWYRFLKTVRADGPRMMELMEESSMHPRNLEISNYILYDTHPNIPRWTRKRAFKAILRELFK